MRNYFDEFKKERIILLNKEINATSSDEVVGQFLAFNSISDKPIHLYVSSPGGSVYDALKIIDMMHMINAPVHVFCTGLVASAGVLIAINGVKNYRYASEHCTFMIHQPSVAFDRATISDLHIGIQEGLRLKHLSMKMMCECTGQPEDVIRRDIERDFYMTSQEAVQYGLIDRVIEKKRAIVVDYAHAIIE